MSKRYQYWVSRVINISCQSFMFRRLQRSATNFFLLLKLKRSGYNHRELQLAYQSLIMGNVQYGNNVYGCLRDLYLSIIDKLQWRAVGVNLVKGYILIHVLISNRDNKLLSYSENTTTSPGSNHPCEIKLCLSKTEIPTPGYILLNLEVIP